MATELLAYDVKTSFFSADVANQAAVNAAVAHLAGELGPVDILFNNAGIASFGKLAEMPVAEWERIINVNLLGMYYVTRAVLPAMLERQTGDIINISSTSGKQALAGRSAYSASKFAILGLTEALMQEVRQSNIRVSALTPSTVATELALSHQLTDGDPERVMQPEDIAEFVVAQLKLPQRVSIKEAGLWSTNP